MKVWLCHLLDIKNNEELLVGVCADEVSAIDFAESFKKQYDLFLSYDIDEVHVYTGENYQFIVSPSEVYQKPTSPWSNDGGPLFRGC